MILHVKKACLRREERDKEDIDALACQHASACIIILTTLIPPVPPTPHPTPHPHQAQLLPHHTFTTKVYSRVQQLPFVSSTSSHPKPNLLLYTSLLIRFFLLLHFMHRCIEPRFPIVSRTIDIIGHSEAVTLLSTRKVIDSIKIQLSGNMWCF